VGTEGGECDVQEDDDEDEQEVGQAGLLMAQTSAIFPALSDNVKKTTPKRKPRR
jgi:hypothetical protein